MRNKAAFLFVLIIVLVGCNSKRQQGYTTRLDLLDSLVEIQPAHVLDSLEELQSRKLSKFNSAYAHVLQTIAQDKTYTEFTSDSLMTAATATLKHYKNKAPREYAHSLMYLGLVRYRMGVTDSTAYQPLKEATELYKKHSSKTRINYLCNYYLGELHDKNNNTALSERYNQLALRNAKQLNDTLYLFTCYRSLFWNQMKKPDYIKANLYLDTLSRFDMKDTYYFIDLLNMQVVYYQKTLNYSKALDTEKRLLKVKKANNQDISLSDLYNMSNSYKKLGLLDSALYYSRSTVQSISDSTYHLNYLYYKNLAEISAKLQKWSESANAYRKTYELMDQTNEKNMDTRILELEKKYDKSEAEKKALLYRNRNILTTTVAVFLMILLVTLLIIWSQRHKQMQLKQLLYEQKTMALEKNNQLLKERQQRLQLEKDITDQQIMEQQFLLPLYEQITTRNTLMRKFLYDLTTNTYINKMPFLHEKIKNEFKLFDETVHAKNLESLTDEDFSKVTRLTGKELQLLNKIEKLLLSLLVMKVPHQQISVLLNTTPESLSSRKLKLKKKMELNDIKMD